MFSLVLYLMLCGGAGQQRTNRHFISVVVFSAVLVFSIECGAVFDVVWWCWPAEN